MNCKKVKKKLPLFIGSDLSPEWMLKLSDHLESCSRCRREYEKYVKSREVLTEWLQEVGPVWNEFEWINTVKKAVRPEIRNRAVFAPWPFKKIWAYAFMALAAFVLSLVFIFPVLRRSKEGMEFSPYFFGSFEKGKQDIVTMTIVSKETGTKIVWFFDKNFQMEE